MQQALSECTRLNEALFADTETRTCLDCKYEIHAMIKVGDQYVFSYWKSNYAS